jgi:hypothetical protein
MTKIFVALVDLTAIRVGVTVMLGKFVDLKFVEIDRRET